MLKLWLLFLLFSAITATSSSQKKQYSLDDLNRMLETEQNPELIVYLTKIKNNLVNGMRRDEEERRAEIYRKYLARRVRTKFLTDFLVNRYY